VVYHRPRFAGKLPLAELINKVIGQKVGDVKLWDWERVVEETVRVYQGEA